MSGMGIYHISHPVTILATADFQQLHAEIERLQAENAALRERAERANRLASAVRRASSLRMQFLSEIEHCRMCGAWAWRGDKIIHEPDCPVPGWLAILAEYDALDAIAEAQP